MSLTQWLHQKIASLELQIVESSVFTADRACSPEELMELKRIVIIRSFLQQELSRRSIEEEASLPMVAVSPAPSRSYASSTAR